MPNQILTTLQTIKVTNVGKITVTDRVEDEDNSVWVREIRIDGTVADGSPRVFVLRLEGEDEDSIRIDAPLQGF